MTLRVGTPVAGWSIPRQSAVDDPDSIEQRRVEVEPVTPLESRRAAPIRRVALSLDDTRAYVTSAFDEHQREIHSFALHGTRSAEAAEDVTQEAFLRLLHEVSEGRVPDNVRAWLYRVVSNLIVSRGRRQTVAGRWLSALARQDVSFASPERITIGREMHADLQAALGELPRDTRVALLMAAQGFGGREISEAIGRSEAATRTMLCRARLQLRQRLESTVDGR